MKDVRQRTDDELIALQRKISRVYKQAQKELKVKWQEYMDNSAVKITRYEDDYKEALKGGNSDAIKIAKEKLANAKKWETTYNSYYRDMVDETTLRLSKANQIALAYINDKTPSIYAMNFNDANIDASNLGLDFAIVNENAVKNLFGKVHYKQLDVDKDRKWNSKRINSSVLQGIIQGESMPMIAKRILPVVHNNEVSAITTARTMVTEAENHGKYDSYNELRKQGIVMEDEWIATADSRTRDWHLVMDGQKRNADGVFVDGNGNKLKYPADSDAPAETVINCRCGLASNIIGFRKADGSIAYIDYDRSKDPVSLHEMQMQIEREKRKIRGDLKKETNKITTLDIGEAPKRPKRDAFENEEDYYTARDIYRSEKEKYEEKMKNLQSEWLTAERKYNTREAFSEWAKMYDVNVTESFYEHVDKRLYDEIISAEEEMFKRFPEVKAYQDSFYKWELNFTGDSGYIMEGSTGINFGRRFEDASSVYYAVADMQTHGVLTFGDGTLKTLIRHEYGHEADGYCRSKFKTLYDTYDDWVSGKTERKFQTLRKYENELSEITAKYGSEYSKVNFAEAFAEGFAEYTSNPASEYGKAFGEFFERWYYANPVE